jgi:predicted phage terminase large subunit-like protein
MLGLDTLYKLRLLKETNKPEFQAIFSSLDKPVQAYIANHWYFGTARMDQIFKWDAEWRLLVIKPGRGWGKNWAASENLIDYGLANPGHRINCFAQSYDDCNDTLIRGESGMENALRRRGIELIYGTARDTPPEGKALYLMSKGSIMIKLANGSMFRFYGPNKTRGKQSHLTYVDEFFCWYEDEGARDKKLDRMFQEIMTTTRLGENPRIIITSTPQPVPILKKLYERQEAKNDTLIIHGSTFDNPFLSDTYKQDLLEAVGGTSRGQQELYGNETWEIPGALWNTGLFKYVDNLDGLDIVRTLVAIDPAATSNKNSDETGIIVVSKGRDKTYYVLEDSSFKGSPREWATKAIHLYDKYQADRIIYESNQGGDMVAETIRNVRRNVPIKAVRASKGKYARAEPIAALYEQGKVYHTGMLVELEKQLCEYNPEFYKGSPDRLDALVWGLHELSTTGEYGVYRV